MTTVKPAALPGTMLVKCIRKKDTPGLSKTSFSQTIPAPPASGGEAMSSACSLPSTAGSAAAPKQHAARATQNAVPIADALRAKTSPLRQYDYSSSADV